MIARRQEARSAHACKFHMILHKECVSKPSGPMAADCRFIKGRISCQRLRPVYQRRSPFYQAQWPFCQGQAQWAVLVVQKRPNGQTSRFEPRMPDSTLFRTMNLSAAGPSHASPMARPNASGKVAQSQVARSQLAQSQVAQSQES